MISVTLGVKDLGDAQDDIENIAERSGSKVTSTKGFAEDGGPVTMRVRVAPSNLRTVYEEVIELGTDKGIEPCCSSKVTRILNITLLQDRKPDSTVHSKTFESETHNERNFVFVGASGTFMQLTGLMMQPLTYIGSGLSIRDSRRTAQLSIQSYSLQTEISDEIDSDPEKEKERLKLRQKNAVLLSL